MTSFENKKKMDLVRDRFRQKLSDDLRVAICDRIVETYEQYKRDADTVEAEEFFSATGDIRDEEIEEYAEIISEAIAIFVERNTRYRGLWKQVGWRGVLFDAKRKMERMWGEFWPGRKLAPDDIDSALDQINFLVFFGIGYTKGYEGTTDWRIGEKHTPEVCRHPNLPGAKKELHDI